MGSAFERFSENTIADVGLEDRADDAALSGTRFTKYNDVGNGFLGNSISMVINISNKRASTSCDTASIIFSTSSREKAIVRRSERLV